MFSVLFSLNNLLEKNESAVIWKAMMFTWYPSLQCSVIIVYFTGHLLIGWSQNISVSVGVIGSYIQYGPKFECVGTNNSHNKEKYHIGLKSMFTTSFYLLSLDLLWEYWIQHGANGPLYVTSCYSTWIFCRGVSGFATDCPCDVWCRGLTTCLLHVGPPFGNRILNNSWAVGLT